MNSTNTTLETCNARNDHFADHDLPPLGKEEWDMIAGGAPTVNYE